MRNLSFSPTPIFKNSFVFPSFVSCIVNNLVLILLLFKKKYPCELLLYFLRSLRFIRENKWDWCGPPARATRAREAEPPVLRP